MNKILDLGCGDRKLAYKQKFPDYSFEGEVIGLDLNKTKQTDIVYDLNKGKLPFKDNHFDIVYTHHTLEHIKNVFEVVIEAHRVLKKGGYFLVCAPHISYTDSLGSLVHVRLFSYSTLDFIIEGHKLLVTERRFEVIRRRIRFGTLYRLMGIEFLANKFPNIYNGFFMGIFPAREMHWELKKI